MTDTKQLFIEAGQSQLFHNWESLSRKDQEELLSNLEQISSKRSPAKLLEDCQNAIKFSLANSSKDTGVDISPLPLLRTSRLLATVRKKMNTGV